MSESNLFGPPYAAFYDHFYAGKNYAAECDFVEAMCARHAETPVRSVLDLGCGTGGHALILAQRGYQVTGVDQSETMLAVARAKAAASGLAAPPTFALGDVRSLALHRTYDAVIAMFAVMSYLTTNEDLIAALQAAHRHLAPGGLLIFDAWFGPGVLADPPTDRVKTIATAAGRVVRMVHPETDLLAQTVRLEYHILQLQAAQLVHEHRETHLMRFFFPQEIACLLQHTGFRLQELCPLLAPGQRPSERDWNVVVVARAVEVAAAAHRQPTRLR